MAKFNFTELPSEPNWLVESLIPLNQLCIFLAQSGVGKSLVVESLAVNLVYGYPFCDFKTVEGDTLIIDQDTPTEVLNRRIIQFSKGMKGQPKYNLYVESMQGHSLDNRTLMTIINNHPTARLVIIDSLHSVCGKLNSNYTSDMSVLAKLKSSCLNGDRTIIINHHISEKNDFTIDQLMLDNSHKMAMGNSAIIQQADSYYIIGASASNGRTDKIYIRPVAKRVKIKSSPLVLQIIELESNSERFEYLNTYAPELSEVEHNIITFFRISPSDRTVKEVYEGMGHQHGETETRKALAALTKRGILLLSRHQSNLFKYKLP